MCMVFLLTLSVAQAGVHATTRTFRPSQFHVESADAAWDTITCESRGQSLGAATSNSLRDSPRFRGHVPRYDVVLGEGMDVSDEAGAPQLPVEPVVIALPGQQRITAVTFEVGEWKALGGECNVLPAQKQQVLVAGTDLAPKSKGKGQKPRAKAEGGVGFTAPNPSIYQSAKPYPASVARWTGTSYRHESTFVQVLVYPVRYIGAEQRVEVCRGIKVKVEVQPKAEVRRQNAEGRSADWLDGGFEYLIVTGAELDSVFQRLADWKTQKGVPAVVRTMDWVYANYTGRDQAEQLRNYVKTLPDSGVKYVRSARRLR